MTREKVKIWMMVKDMEIGPQRGREMNISLMLSTLAAQIYRTGANAGYAGQDISAMANFLGSFAGVDFTSVGEKS
ncbi:MAG: NAD-binding protein [Smithellaceae bacterium]|nr:NAD-binding protein [Smithellaceae bacterium]